MKKTTIIITAAILLLAFSTEKFVTVKFTEEQINYHWNGLNQIKAIVDQSNLPHDQVKHIVQTVDSLQHSIQASAKIDSTTKK